VTEKEDILATKKWALPGQEKTPFTANCKNVDVSKIG